MSLELHLAASGRAQAALPLTEHTVTIGSLASNRIALAEPGIEPIHALIDRDNDGTWRVTDLGTLAGVKVNGERITVERALRAGDVVEIGSARLLVREATAVAAPLAAAAGAEALSRLFYHPRREATGGRLLEVIAYWGDTVLNVDHFHPSLKGFESVTIGDPSKAHFISGGREFFKSAVLAEVDERQSTLRLLDGMVAHVRQDGKVRKVEGQRRMTLGPRDYAHVEFGPVRYFLHWANQPRVELPRNTARDNLLAALSALGALAYLVLVGLALTIEPKPIPPAERDDTPWDVRYTQQPVEPQRQRRQIVQIADVRREPVVKPEKQEKQEIKQAVRPVPPVVTQKPPVQVAQQKQPKPPTTGAKEALRPQAPNPFPNPTPTNVARPANDRPSPVASNDPLKAPGAGTRGAAAGEQRPSRLVGNSGGPGQRLAANPAPAKGTTGAENPGVEDGKKPTPSFVDLKRLSANGLGPVMTKDGPGGINVAFNSTAGSQGMKGGTASGRHSLGGTGTQQGIAVPGSGDRIGGWGQGPGGIYRGGNGPGGGTDVAGVFNPGGGRGPSGGGHTAANVLLPQDPVMPGGGLSPEEVMRVIRSHLNEIRHCYERLLQRSPNAAGKMTVAFQIGLDGRVASPRVAQDTVNDAQMRGCVVGKVARWSFPKPRGTAPVAVTYPFVFNPL